jgi:uncharacterized membrane protein YeiH
MILATNVIQWGTWKFTGSFSAIDFLAASTNALNGALLARRPDHYKNFTRTGIILMAILGGIGGGVTRDVLLNKVPVAFTNPVYISLCLIFGLIGYELAFGKGQLFREGIFQLATAFSLPWYAIIGAYTAVKAGLPVIGALAIAVIASTAGRYLIDITCGVPPKQFVRGEFFVATALLTGAVWLLCYSADMSTWPAVLIAFAVGFSVRLLALFLGWEEPLAKEPKGVYIHSDGRPLLGRKLAGKSQRELRDLGLEIDPDNAEADAPAA